MDEPLTPHATIPRPADVAAALAEIEATEPVTIDPSRFARIGGEVVPLPRVAEAACESPRLSTLQDLSEEPDTDA